MIKTKFLRVNEEIESYGDEKWFEFDGEELSNYIETFLSTENVEKFLERINDNDENIYVKLAHPTDNLSTYYRIVAGWRNDTDMSDEEYANSCINLIKYTINYTVHQSMSCFYNENIDKFEEYVEDGYYNYYETLSCLCTIYKDGKMCMFDMDYYDNNISDIHIVKNEFDIPEEELEELLDMFDVMSPCDNIEYNGYELSTEDITYYDTVKDEKMTVY